MQLNNVEVRRSGKCVKEFIMSGLRLCILPILAAAATQAAWADGEKRPMALMVMFDGLRADGIESGYMPNVEKIRNGTWQKGYKAAWTISAQITPGSVPSSAPNHASIATGYGPSAHGVSANGETSSGDYSTYPTWLKRVVDAKSGATALFAYSWSEDADLGPAEGVTFLGQTDVENGASVAERLASSDAPDATMFFIDAPDAAGHSGGFYPHSTAYQTALATSDSYLGACLNAIAGRSTFDEEDWLIIIVSDHGGYSTQHGTITTPQGYTVPIVISGTGVTEGRIPGVSYNYDVAATALAHFGITVDGMPATSRLTSAVTDTSRLYSDGLAVYLPFNGDYENKVAGSSVTAVANASPAVTANGFVGSYLNIPSGSYIRLEGSKDLAYENGNKSFTTIVWVKAANLAYKAGDPVVLGNKKWSGGAKGMLITNGKLQEYSGSSRAYGMNAGNGTDRVDLFPFDGEGESYWTFYAATYTDEGVFTFYQGRNDGTLNWASGTLDGFTMSSGYPFCIGQDGTGSYGNKFVGGVDDVAIWTRGMTHEDIKRIYENGRAGMELNDLLTMDANDEPTVTIEDYDSSTSTYTLSFGGRRTHAHQLYVASGATDGGGNKYAWSNFTHVAEIAAGTTSYEYVVPQAWQDAGTLFRFFLLQTTDLPYAKEVSYVHSDGSAYIDTGVAPRRTMVTEFDTRLTGNGGKYQNFFGAFTSSTSGNAGKRSNYGLCRYYNSSDSSDANNDKWDREYNTGLSYQFTGTCVQDTDYHVVFSTTNLFVNGEELLSGITLDDFVEGGYTINVFRNAKLGSQYDQTIIGWMKSFSLSTPKRVARDFQPAVDGNDVVGMFDGVTGSFYASAGSSAFTAGEDLATDRLGWIRAQTATLTTDATTPVTATWTGLGTDVSDHSDPANWICYNAFEAVLADVVPTSDTAITISGSTTFNIPTNSTLAYKSIAFSSVTPPTNADWTGLDLGRVAAGSVIDLAGKSLTFTGFDGDTTASFTVTDSSTDENNPGTLTFDVPSGADFANRTIALSGNLRMVKAGEGVLTARMSQSYTGGTLIAAGTAKFGQSSAYLPFGAASGKITVSSNAVIDCWSKSVNYYHFVLDGGSFNNTYCTENGDMNQNIANLTLTADSQMLFDSQGSISQDKQIVDNTVWDLGGHTLTVKFQGTDPDVWFVKGGNNSGTTGLLTLKNGTLKTEIVSGVKGWWHDTRTDGTQGGSYDLGTIYRHYGVSTVSNLTFSSTISNDGGGSGVYKVYGTFTPLSTYGHNVQMLNGSTIDLSSKTGAFSTTYPSGHTVTFAEGEADAPNTVTVNLAGRTDLKTIADSESPYVITWSTAPANVKFVPDCGARKCAYVLSVEDGGLKLISKGTIIIIR